MWSQCAKLNKPTLSGRIDICGVLVLSSDINDGQCSIVFVVPIVTKGSIVKNVKRTTILQYTGESLIDRLNLSADTCNGQSTSAFVISYGTYLS